MQKQKFTQSLPFRLLLALGIGIVLGLFVSEGVMKFVLPINYVLGQLINFCVPLIIIAFVAPSIVTLGENASRMLRFAVIIAYLSSIGAAFFSMGAGYGIIPKLNIANNVEDLRTPPDLAFELNIPPIMSVMSALVFAVLIGLAVTRTQSKTWAKLLNEFQKIVLNIVQTLIIPILPFFIGTTFINLTWQGILTKQLPVFIIVILLVMLGHYIWLALLYGIAGAYSHEKASLVLKQYGPAYLTAVGTMSSAATMAVALEGAKRAVPPLREDMVNFGIPLFSNIHLCGSVLTETFFVMVVSQILYHQLPSVGTMVAFCLLLGIFAIGAPGVPGGTVMASLGLITGVLGFDASGTALVLAIFALQDSFGTACNITGDGALTLILTGYANKHNISDQTENFKKMMAED